METAAARPTLEQRLAVVRPQCKMLTEIVVRSLTGLRGYGGGGGHPGAAPGHGELVCDIFYFSKEFLRYGKIGGTRGDGGGAGQRLAVVRSAPCKCLIEHLRASEMLSNPLFMYLRRVWGSGCEPFQSGRCLSTTLNPKPWQQTCKCGLETRSRSAVSRCPQQMQRLGRILRSC